MATIDVSRFAQDFQNSANFQAFIATANRSPLLVSEINALPPSSIRLQSGGGTFTVPNSSGAKITLDSALLSSSEPYQLTQAAVALGHELGHAELPNGIETWQDITSPAYATGSGLLAEATAAVNEYNVAKQLGTPMYSDAAMLATGNPANTLQAQLDRLNVSITADATCISNKFRPRKPTLPA